MSATSRSAEQPTERETMHALLNALASARIWSTVLANARPTERMAALSDSLGKLDRSIGEALDYGHQLRGILATGRRGRAAGGGVSAAGAAGEPRPRTRRKPPR